MKRVTSLSLIIFVLAIGSRDLLAMERKKNNRNKPQPVEAKNNPGKKRKNARKKIHDQQNYVKGNGIKILETDIDKQTSEQLIPLFKGLHSSVSITTPKEEAQKKYRHSRLVYDALTKIYGDKKKTKEALDGVADDFSDEETHMKALWEYKSNEEIADPSAVYLGLMYGYTSAWKHNVYEEMKNKHLLHEKNNELIAAEELELKSLGDQIAELQKQAETKREKVKTLNATKEHFESKLVTAEEYSRELGEDLATQIKETVGLIANLDHDLESLEARSSQLRKINSAVVEFNALITKNKEDKESLLKQKASAELRKKKLTEALEHINQYLPKARSEGSIGRRYVWGKSF